MSLNVDLPSTDGWFTARAPCYDDETALVHSFNHERVHI